MRIVTEAGGRHGGLSCVTDLCLHLIHCSGASTDILYKVKRAIGSTLPRPGVYVCGGQRITFGVPYLLLLSRLA